ncbi:unnamed protein product [Effrenium voratum]|nr:unnamed protein product [Effrenium voratum]
MLHSAVAQAQLFFAIVSELPARAAPSPAGRARALPAERPRTRSAALAAVLAGARCGARWRRIALGASRDSEGRKISEPPTFDASDASSVLSTHLVEFRERPFGVLAYAPSTSGRGAMVWELGAERYPNDPQGRARRCGVQEGFIVRKINGQDVSAWDFDDILDVLGDKTLDNSSGKFQCLSRGSRKSSAAELPVSLELVTCRPTTAPSVSAHEAPCEAAEAAVSALRYPGPRGVDDAFVAQLLRVQGEHPGEVVFSLEEAIRLVEDAKRVFQGEETLQRVQLDQVVIVGDLHGQFFDLLRVFEALGLPSEARPFLFNGDFVDRGDHSLEVIFTLLALKLRFPRQVMLNRGNHEAADLNLRYGFAQEIRDRYGVQGRRLFEAFAEAFRWLPLAHVLSDQVFVVHGGLPGPDPRLPFKDEGGAGTGYAAQAASGRRGGGQKLSLLGYNPDNVSLPPRRCELSLADIAALPRGADPAVELGALRELPEEEAEVQRLIVDLLWADPRGKTGYGPSYRVRKGCYIFGPDVTSAFLRRNGLRLMIRSHEVKVAGYEWTHPDCITVFSAPNYLGHAQNRGAVIQLALDEQGFLAPSFLSFAAEGGLVSS